MRKRDAIVNLSAGIARLPRKPDALRASAATLLLGLAGCFASPHRGPYLQLQKPRDISIRWRTDESVLACTLAIGDAPDEISRSVSARELPTRSWGVRDWIATVDKLEPDQRYFYTVTSSGLTLYGGDDGHHFTTAPEGGTARPFRFWVLGDGGTNRRGSIDPGAVRARDGFRRYSGDRVDGVLLLGDNAYTGGTDRQYQTAFFEVYAAVLARVPVWPCLGNHEIADAYFEIFSVPTAGEIGGVPSASPNYYSFDFANTHFVVLDMTRAEWRHPDAPQLRWLEADLAACDRDWVVVANHFPPYCDGKYDSDRIEVHVDVRQIVLPILERHGVDLLLTGHDHTYQRSFLLDGHYGSRDTFDPQKHLKDRGDCRHEPCRKRGGPHGGLITVVTGTAGSFARAEDSRVRGGTLNHPAMVPQPDGEQSGRGYRRLGTFVLDIDGLTLEGRQIDEEGRVLDHFTLKKVME